MLHSLPATVSVEGDRGKACSDLLPVVEIPIVKVDSVQQRVGVKVGNSGLVKLPFDPEKVAELQLPSAVFQSDQCEMTASPT